MAIYTVHEPPLKRYEVAPDPERFVLVRDGFSIWAFLFTPLWMLWHRMWLVLIGYVATVVIAQFALHMFGASQSLRLVVGVLIALVAGLEAGTLRRFTLARRGYRNVGLVAGDDMEAAERRFFDGWVQHETPAPPPASTRVAADAPDVIGLFPEPGAQR